VNDRWRHSQWLEFLYRRLLLARDLLTPDGVILISINDENRARLELLMEEVMPGRRLGSFVWRTRKGSNDSNEGLLGCDHEHILVFANQGFEFLGAGRDETKYANPDNDPRGDWGSQMLIQSKNAKDRPEAYYSISNPDTNTWYLCDPDSVWRFSSTSRPLNKKKLQADPIEIIISEKRILWPANEKTVTYSSLEELKTAIQFGNAPSEFRIYEQIEELKKQSATDKKILRLLEYIEPLDFWVGKKIGFGRPRYKRFRSQLKREVNPISSWIKFASDDEIDDEYDSFVAGGTSEGTALVRKILGNKDFPYPKPLSLIKNLLAQASQPNDTILDFFAGSGTTAHAVLALNAEDGGKRKFILCSSTEATHKEPDKNLCRDVCAERVRRVIKGANGKDGFSPEQGGQFAYFGLEKIPPADLGYELKAPQAHAWLMLHRLRLYHPTPEADIQPLGRIEDCDLLLVHKVDQSILSALKNWPQQHGCARLAVYCNRPESLAESLEGVPANVYGLVQTLGGRV
jgi:adenine-specific DNA-methyltransferase